MLKRIRHLSTSARAVLGASFLLGTAQQIFVIARNPLLSELGFQPHVIPRVQAIGAAAGVLAGVLATWLTPRVRPSTVFAACAGLQALGFLLQAAASAPAGFLIGSVVAGIAIQLNTAAVPPVLARLADTENRPAAFAAHAIALTGLAGVVSSVLVAALTHAFGAGVVGHRAALLAAVAVSSVAIGLFRRVDGAPLPPRGGSRRELPRRVLVCVALQGLSSFAGGLMFPFLPLYFKLTFGVPLQGIAVIHGVTMALGTVSFALAPRLVARFGLLRAVVGLQVAMVPLFLELASTGAQATAAAALVLRHALAAAAAPLSTAFLQTVSPGRDGESVAGLGMVTGSVTWTLGSLLAGPLIAADLGGFRLALYASAAAFTLVAAVNGLALPWLWRTRPEKA